MSRDKTTIETLTRGKILEAIARGWRSKWNEHKEMDVGLADAIATEIQALIARGDDLPEEPDEHYSDCAVYNEPAMPVGKCNCGGYPTRYSIEEGYNSMMADRKGDYVLLEDFQILRSHAQALAARLAGLEQGE